MLVGLLRFKFEDTKKKKSGNPILQNAFDQIALIVYQYVKFSNSKFSKKKSY